MTIMTLVAALCCVAQDNAEAYWKFQVGTRLTFEENQGGNKKTTVLEVVKHEKGKVYLKSTEASGADDKNPKVETLVSYVKDGYVVWAVEKEGKVEEQFRILKVGAKKGDTWKSLMGDSRVEGTFTHMGMTGVTVPAGKFITLHLQFKFEMKGPEGEGASVVGDFYLAPNVGPVKIEMKGAGGAGMSMVLKHVVVPKGGR